MQQENDDEYQADTSFRASLHSVLQALNELPGKQDRIQRFAASLPPEWIDEALASTGTASIRRRKIPAQLVIWLVIGMCLFADRAIFDVVDHLRLIMPGVNKLTRSAVAQARKRLGYEPVLLLFNRTAAAWDKTEGTGQQGWKGLQLFGIDGTTLRLQDSNEVFEHFGKPGGRSGPNDSGYPQLRLVTLMSLTSRLLRAAAFGPLKDGEQTLVQPLAEKIPANSLTLFDRGFYSYDWMDRVLDVESNRHVMIRAKKNLTYEITEVLPDGSALAILRACSASRKKHPDTRSEILVRVIEYQHPGGDRCRLFVTLLDPKRYPAKELIKLYHERWELEVGYDEIKTDQLERKECLRSKTVDGVKQEVWGLLLTYNLVRREMLFAAQSHKVSAKRISFKGSLIWIRTFCIMAAQTHSPGNLPKHLGEFRKSLGSLVLPERRSHRRYPRHVKIKMSNYKRNRGKRNEDAVDDRNQGKSSGKVTN